MPDMFSSDSPEVAALRCLPPRRCNNSLHREAQSGQSPDQNRSDRSDSAQQAVPCFSAVRSQWPCLFPGSLWKNSPSLPETHHRKCRRLPLLQPDLHKDESLPFLPSAGNEVQFRWTWQQSGLPPHPSGLSLLLENAASDILFPSFPALPHYENRFSQKSSVSLLSYRQRTANRSIIAVASVSCSAWA